MASTRDWWQIKSIRPTALIDHHIAIVSRYTDVMLFTRADYIPHKGLCSMQNMELIKWINFNYGMNKCIHPLFYMDVITKLYLNPLGAKFFRGNINLYLHFVSFLHIDTTQVVEILPQVEQEPTYSTYSISWLLMSGRRKEPGHQQSWYWLNLTEITQSPHTKG